MTKIDRACGEARAALTQIARAAKACTDSERAELLESAQQKLDLAALLVSETKHGLRRPRLEVA